MLDLPVFCVPDSVACTASGVVSATRLGGSQPSLLVFSFLAESLTHGDLKKDTSDVCRFFPGAPPIDSQPLAQASEECADAEASEARGGNTPQDI